ncbi:MAG: DNA polymerase III subunit delta [Bacteroidetes bacterium]|jgi:DNA polymerase III subunit delta|nr:DNA polymerase III subunit delta [Bacteroidota bacterium]MBT3751073.1 DNA polymerase III subunit delta [Bacteroidota bacterium]MBT4402174.1 DNA polymerase III subunit delta [Bacteroidota bacterium]MBT4412360.1 DNA polymerase III subunit delta [Bacteroidota bacterium]MBT5427854.1 DNA polymerase III subunit delta [Bacteroidota bacterium]
MTFEGIINDINNRVFKPVYILQGEEPYFIDQITERLMNGILDEMQKAFNLNILYGKDTDVPSIDNMARRFPMGADYTVVIVKEAQSISGIEDLQYYVSNPSESSILVIAYKYKTLDKRKKLYKAAKKTGVIFESKKIYDNKVPRWIHNYLASRKISIEPSAGVILTEYLGNDLAKISNELDKLILTLPEGDSKIASDHIEKNIGISKDYNNFELMKALAKKNVLKANRIVQYFGSNQKLNHINQTISSLYYFFSKVLALHFMQSDSNREIASTLQINPYFVQDYQQAARNYSRSKVVEIISILREFDLKSKGFGNPSVPADELLQEMIFKILH